MRLYDFNAHGYDSMLYYNGKEFLSPTAKGLKVTSLK